MKVKPKVISVIYKVNTKELKKALDLLNKIEAVLKRIKL